jgi:hypothetical protein
VRVWAKRSGGRWDMSTRVFALGALLNTRHIPPIEVRSARDLQTLVSGNGT